jgi:hypothetical protein
MLRFSVLFEWVKCYSSRCMMCHKDTVLSIQSAAEITPTFQLGITNKWYEVSPKTFHFPNVDIKTFFTLGFQNYIVQMVAVTADTHLEPFFLNALL